METLKNKNFPITLGLPKIGFLVEMYSFPKETNIWGPKTEAYVI